MIGVCTSATSSRKEKKQEEEEVLIQRRTTKNKAVIAAAATIAATIPVGSVANGHTIAVYKQTRIAATTRALVMAKG